MKVKIDDGYDWVFMRSDGKVFDSCGKQVNWVPIGDWQNPSGYTWKPIGNDDDELEEINWLPIGDDEPMDEPIYEGKRSKTPSKETKNGSAK